MEEPALRGDEEVVQVPVTHAQHVRHDAVRR